MEAKASSKQIRVSPLKMRPYADAVRGKNLEKAFGWLKTCALKRVEPLKKVLFSAYHNAKSNAQDGEGAAMGMSQFRIKEIRVDQGPTIRYFKAGAMGRVSPQRRRMCHLSVVVERMADSEKVRG